MNDWTQISIEFANQRNYLDELFGVYPTIPEGIRDIDGDLWEQVEQSFQERDNTARHRSIRVRHKSNNP